MANQMNAVGFYEGQAITAQDSFIDFKKDIPTPTGHDILVGVTALSINPVDVKIRTTTPKQNTPKVIGYDAVGVIKAIGDKVTKFAVGDRVYYSGSTQRDGSQQQFQLVNEYIAALAPKSLSDAEAAALPLTALVSYELLFDKFGLTPQAQTNAGKTLLVINGAGGVGSIFNQLAHWAGLTVYATGSPDSFDWLKKTGVQFPIDYHDQLGDALKKDGVDRVDYIASLFDITAYLPQLTDLIIPFGHIGTIVGVNEPLALEPLKNLSVSFDWEYMFTKTDFNIQLASQGEILAQIAALVDAGDLFTTVYKTYDTGINAQNIKAATADIETGHAKGKIIVTGEFNGI